MGIGPIPVLSHVRPYGEDILGLSGDELERFVYIIREMDAAYIEASNSASKSLSSGDMREEVSSDDAAGVRGLFKKLTLQHKKPSAKKTR